VADLGFGKGGHGERGKRVYNKGLGAENGQDPGAEQLVRRSWGEASLKLKHLVFGCSMGAANLPTFL